MPTEIVCEAKDCIHWEDYRCIKSKPIHISFECCCKDFNHK